MAGLPTIVVKLDDGTGTFPYDISSYVDLARGITITRGRADEFSQVQPSSLSLTLDNIDGRFTYGATTYASGIFVDQQIRVTETVGATTSHRFTGYVQNWPTAWPDGGDTYAVAEITATDRLARFARRQLRSVVENEFVLDSPHAYFTLGEPSDSTSAGDTSGNAKPPLGILGQGAAPVFGTATGAGTDGLSAATFTAGKYLGQTNYGSIGDASGVVFALGAECFFQTSGVSQRLITIESQTAFGSGVLDLYVNSSGRLESRVGGAVLTSAATVNSGQTHHAYVGGVEGLTHVLYLDGALVASVAIVGITNGPIRLSVGGNGNGETLTGTISHVAVYSGANNLTAARVAAHAAAGLTGFSTERSDQRVARVATYANVPTGQQALELGLQAAVPNSLTSGASVASALSDLEASEGGLIFIRGDGTLVFQNRTHRTVQTSADWTVTTHDLAADAVFTADTQGLVNYATARGVSGVGQVAQDAASITTHEQSPTDLDLLVTNDAEALDAASWLVTVASTPTPRLPDVSLDLLTQTSLFQQAALALELSDRLRITGLPSQAPNSTADLVVEGWTETIARDSWSMALNTSNFSAFTAWILQDATYGALDSTTRLHY